MIFINKILYSPFRNSIYYPGLELVFLNNFTNFLKIFVIEFIF